MLMSRGVKVVRMRVAAEMMARRGVEEVRVRVAAAMMAHRGVGVVMVMMTVMMVMAVVRVEVWRRREEGSGPEAAWGGIEGDGGDGDGDISS